MKAVTFWPAPLLLFLIGAFSPLIAISQSLPSYPLAVRSPYLSTWLSGSSAHDVPSGKVTFWNGQSLTWLVVAKIDDTPYTLFGAPKGVNGAQKAKQMSITYTATRTIVKLAAGSSTITLDFFSPVDPENDIRHSLPYSYLSVSATAKSACNISIFSAIDGSWVGSKQDRVSSNHSMNGNSSIFEMEYEDPVTFTEEDQMAAWGTTVFATASHSGEHITGSVASASDTLSTFTKTGSLSKSYPRYKSGDLVALAQSFQGVANASVTFAVGHYREKAINWLDQEYRTGFFRSKYPDVASSVSHFLADYQAASMSSQKLDQKIRSAATQISRNYSSIVEAATRQAFGVMELTIPGGANDTSDPWAFYKEISSDGNVCSLDSMYHLLPIFKVIAPKYIKRLLEPYLAYLKTGGWPHPWAVHDIGSHYPNATGHNNGDAEQMPVLASGTLITFIYAWQYISNDTTLASLHRPLLQGYADYIYKNGLYTAAQLSTVDSIAPSANQTELAVSSAVALKAFGATFKGMENYTRQGEHFADVVYKQGLGVGSEGRQHYFSFNLAPSTSKWGLTFSLFPDALLQLNTFPAAAYALQSSWIAGEFKKYGVQYASLFANMNVPFAFWAAATSGTAVTKKVVDTTLLGLTSGINDVPFPDVINVLSGKYTMAHARGTVGGTFALMAMNHTGISS